MIKTFDIPDAIINTIGEQEIETKVMDFIKSEYGLLIKSERQQDFDNLNLTIDNEIKVETDKIKITKG